MSVTCDIDPRATSLFPRRTIACVEAMHLQILAVTENGASKMLPKCSDTLRVLFIVPEIPDEPTRRERRDRDLEIAERRRHLMASLATGGI